MGISTLQWNANGLLLRQAELKQYLANNEYDIICIQETFLKAEKQFNLSGYEVIRKDRDSAKGGLMMLPRQGIKYTLFPSPPNIECQIAEVTTKSGKLTVINVYVPPTTEIDENIFQSLFTRPNTIIMGDLNAKNKLWNSTTENARGRVIEQLLIQNNFVILNTGQPTYQNSRGQVSHIDLTLVSNNLATKCSWYTLGSDHSPIISHIDEYPSVETTMIPKWTLNEADWKTYKELCSSHVYTTPVYDSDIESFANNISNMITAAANNTIPTRKSSHKKKRKALPYWNARIKSTIYERNAARNKMNRKLCS